MTIAKLMAALCMTIMAGALIWGFAAGDFFEEGRVIFSTTWGIVSIIDVYVGLVLFSGWIVYRERSAVRSVPWVAALMVLGFFAASLYALIELQRSGGSWRRFWMGVRAAETAVSPADAT
jgi:hypothetical protein